MMHQRATTTAQNIILHFTNVNIEINEMGQGTNNSTSHVRVYNNCQLSLVSHQFSLYYQLVLSDDKFQPIVCKEFNSELIVVKRDSSSQCHYSLVNTNSVINLTFMNPVEQMALFERMCYECHVQLHAINSTTAPNNMVEQSNHRRTMSGLLPTTEVIADSQALSEQTDNLVPTSQYRSQSAMLIDSTANIVATNMIYGASLLGNGMIYTGKYIRENVVKDNKQDIKIPRVITGTVYAGAATTGVTAKATHAVVNGIVHGASFAGRVVLTPLAWMIGANKNSSNSAPINPNEPISYWDATKEVAHSTFNGVGHVLNAVTESKDKVVTDLSSSAGDTVAYAYGNDAAQISRDSISTVNNCVNVFSNTAGFKFGGFMSKMTKRSVKAAAKEGFHTIAGTSRDQSTSTSTQ
jgi:hypothetical protein